MVCFLASCKEENNNPPEAKFSNGFFVLNEGNFGSANSSVDFYSRDEGLSSDVYAAANAGLSPGDVLQSMSEMDGVYYLVVNNSGKIDVINTENFELGMSISGLTSPRYLCEVSPGKAYVSDFFSGSISIVESAGNSVIGEIVTNTWTERIVSHGNRAYIALMARDQIWVLDAASDILLDSLPSGREPESMLLNDQGNLYVLSTGGFMEAEPELRLINPQSEALLQQWTLGSVGHYVSKLAISPDGDWLYWLGPGGVYRMQSGSATAPASAWISASASSFFYSLGVDRQGSGEVIIGDARDFVSQGMVLRYSPDGVLVDSFSTGSNPGSFYFVP